MAVQRTDAWDYYFPSVCSHGSNNLFQKEIEA